MDGVLIDSEPLWSQAEKEVFTSLGVEMTDERCAITQTLTTVEVTKFWYEVTPWSGVSLDAAEQMVISRLLELIETEECLIDGVKSFIKNLRSKGYKIGLATNSPKRVIPSIMERLDVTHLFDTVTSAQSVEKGKPDPAIYLTTAKKLNVAPENCIAIEDSYTGMLAAKNAGMTVVFFTNGNNQLNNEIADFKLNDYRNIPIDALR